MIIYCDIDGVLMTQDKEHPTLYHKAKPIQKNINKLNKIYDNGHIIVLWTSRGSISGVDYKEITEKQLEVFGIKYHRLDFNKPYYDVLIDDRSRSSLDDI